MFVVMAYDVGEKRVAKVRKIAEKFLLPVQNSVFQGDLTTKQLQRLQYELKGAIIPESDKIIFYKTQFDYALQIDEIGFVSDEEMIL